MKAIFTLIISSSLLLQGCSIFMSYSSTSEIKHEPKPDNCDFKVKVTDSGLSSYEEIGIINGCAGQKDIASYKNTIQPDVCNAGGDLVLARANGFGVFCHGIVFKKISN